MAKSNDEQPYRLFKGNLFNLVRDTKYTLLKRRPPIDATHIMMSPKMKKRFMAEYEAMHDEAITDLNHVHSLTLIENPNHPDDSVSIFCCQKCIAVLRIKDDDTTRKAGVN